MVSFTRIRLVWNNELRWISSAEVLRIEGDNKDSTIYLKNNTSIKQTKLLSKYEEELCHSHFVRIHQSHIVNMLEVVKCDRENIILLSDGKFLPLAKERRKNFMLRMLEVENTVTLLDELKTMVYKLKNEPDNVDERMERKRPG